MTDPDLIDIGDLTDTDIAHLLSRSVEVTDDYLAERRAALGATAADSKPAEVIEPHDTVRFIGKRTHWIVDRIRADGRIELETVTGHARHGGATYRSRAANRNRIELVRKGNRDDDFIKAMDANGGRVDAALPYDYRTGRFTG